MQFQFNKSSIFLHKNGNTICPYDPYINPMKHSLPGLIVSWCVFVCSLKRKQKFHPPKQRSKENGIKFWALSRFFLCLCVTELFIFKGELKVFFVFQFMSKKGNEAKQIICKYVLIFFIKDLFLVETMCVLDAVISITNLFPHLICLCMFINSLTRSMVCIWRSLDLILKQ